LNIFEASSCVGVATGAVGGLWLGFSLFGWLGAVIGLPAGVVIGWFVPPLLVFMVFLLGILFEEGPSGLRKMFRASEKLVPTDNKEPPGDGHDRS
jgi:hypothetical protein